MNVTVANTTAPGFVTVYPCNGQSPPDVSNLNFGSAVAVSNLVSTQVGNGNMVCIATSATTDVIVDIAGFGSDLGFWVPVPLN
jgi:hypothetical protein